jgi:hypothetical protein
MSASASRRDISQNSQVLETTAQIKAAVDAALADYITQFGKGLEFAAGTEGNGSIASDDASSAGTVASASPRDARSADTNSQKFSPQRLSMSAAAAANEMREGDLVRLRRGLEGSSVLVSQRNSDNTVSSHACLGAANLGRVGVVVRAASKSTESPDPQKTTINPNIIWVACATSGLLCEYLASDLVFADGSSLDTLPPPQPAPQPTKAKAENKKITVGSKVEVTKDYATYGDAGTGPLQPGEIGVVTADDGGLTPFKVKAPSGKEWWYKAKAIKIIEDKSKAHEPKGVPFKVGDTVTLAPGAFAFARAAADDSAPADPSPSHEAEKEKNDVGGCCAVTKKDFKGGAKVVRGPDWKWSDQDGGAGNTGILAQSIDSDGWVSVRWTGEGSNKYRVANAKDLLYHSSNCVCHQGSEGLTRKTIIDGDRVRVKKCVTRPRQGWGEVWHESIGVLKRTDGGKGEVDFPEQSGWNCLLADLERC